MAEEEAQEKAEVGSTVEHDPSGFLALQQRAVQAALQECQDGSSLVADGSALIGPSGRLGAMRSGR